VLNHKTVDFYAGDAAICDPELTVSMVIWATTPDGALYVQAFTKGAVRSGPQILAFNRDGSYQRMVMAYPSSLG
jgi:hypothetical protein